jgi:hypothetical protein
VAGSCSTSISLPHETGDIEAEADRLCAVVENQFDGLSEGRQGREFRVREFSFRLYRKDRNTIYQVSDGFTWFLKLPREGDARVIAREHLGAKMIRDAIGARPEYGGAPVLRVSLTPAYVLAATIPGRRLDRALVIESLLPWPGAGARLEQSFGTLGTLLATLHSVARLPADAPHAEKREFAILAKHMRRVSSPDALTRAIEAWYGSHALPDEGAAFVHGNLRLDNVFRDGARIGFLDFEHCGSGSPYQDLARPMVYLLQAAAVSAFARRRVAGCAKAYLAAYHQVHPYDLRTLNAFVSARLNRYYLEARKKGRLAGRLAGVPVPRSSVARLTTTVLRDGIEAVFPRLQVSRL